MRRQNRQSPCRFPCFARLPAQLFRDFADSVGGRICTVATFYLLPSRPVVGEALAWFLQDWLPGLPRLDEKWAALADAVQLAASQRADVFLIFREDLPDDVEAEQALVDGFGAEPGDEIIEWRLAMADRVHSRIWRLGAMSAA
jgi:hypothetical protein